MYQIQHTNTYSKFQFLSTNRNISPSHVKKLVEDPTFPSKFKYSPILVRPSQKKGEFEIIDGQHRFEAAKKLKIPIYYLVDETATWEDIRNRNSNLLPWSGRNFVEFYASLGYPLYVKLQEMKDKYHLKPTFITVVVKFLGGNKDFGDIGREFKNGTLHIDDFENKIDLIIRNLFLPLKNL